MTCADLDLIEAVRIIRRRELSADRIVRFQTRIVRPSMPYRWIHVAEPGGQQWLLRRNCALTPTQLAVCFAAVGVVSLLIATAFAVMGAWLVIPFAGIELLALGVAFLVHARHAGDYERIVVRADRLIVERLNGGNLAQMECQGPWIRVEYGGARRELIRLVAAGREMSVGRFVPDDGRSQLARELRASIAGWRG